MLVIPFTVMVIVLAELIAAAVKAYVRIWPDREIVPPAMAGGLTEPNTGVPAVPGGTLMVTDDRVALADSPKL